MPSKNALAFLTKAAKGIKGGIDPEALAEALPLLGWSVRDEVAVVPLNGETLGLALAALDVQGEGFSGGVREDKTATVAWVHNVALTSAAEAYAAKIRAVVTEAPPGKGAPIAMREGEVVTRGLRVSVGELRRTWGSGEIKAPVSIVVKEAWRGVRGWRVTTPDGAVEFTPKMSYTGRFEPLAETGSDRFWTFAYKAKLREKAKAALAAIGQETVEAALRPASARALLGTGTCPACFANVKLHAGKIMRHGWRVGGHRYKGAQGMSWHSGPCFGFGWLPFEVSREGTMAYVEKVLRPTEASLRERCRVFDTRPPIVVERQSIRRGMEAVTIAPGDPSYESELGSAIRRVEAGLVAVRREIADDEERIAGWVRRPLPGAR